jgi:hypothetical protein
LIRVQRVGLTACDATTMTTAFITEMVSKISSGRYDWSMGRYAVSRVCENIH